MSMSEILPTLMQVMSMINDHWTLQPIWAGEAPIRCHVISGTSQPLWGFRQRPKPRYELRDWWSLHRELGCRDLQMGLHLDVIVFLSTVSLLGFWPLANGICMGFYCLPQQVVFPHVSDLARGDWELNGSIAALMRSHNSIHRMIVLHLVPISFSSRVIGF